MSQVRAQFVAFHEIPESDSPASNTPVFAVVVARCPNGVVLVFNRWRKVWELPGGLIDLGETPRQSAERELTEESGCIARNTTWLGIVEVNDGATHFGAVFACEVDAPPSGFKSDEISAVSLCGRKSHPQPLGHCDAELLNRFT